MSATGAAGDCVLGVDIGGTFTDVVLLDARGHLTLAKCPTTPADPALGMLQGIDEMLERSGTSPASVARIAHATTLATNVILERKGARVAFITTRGFRSMLTLGRAARVESQRFDLFFEVPEPPLPASHCFEVPERVGAGGVVLEPLDMGAAREVARQVADLGVEGVALCFLHSYAYDAHERQMADLLRDLLPSASVVASSEIWPELREYERATTTLMSAYVGPVMEGYLASLSSRLSERGIEAPVHIMDSSGGVMSAALAARRAVHTIESGPAAGVMAAVRIGRVMGLSNLLSFDMGGTTAKAGIVREGRADITHSFHVGGSGSFGGRREGTGLPIKVPAIDLAEVGAGGGSIARVGGDGVLHVGPHSAGARPGPACYGFGGEAPTVTDADLVLGYLNPDFFAGGSLPLHPERSRRALEQGLCGPLGIGVAEAAHAIHEIANANMGSAVHVVTVQRGIDPRRFAMVALGGAGPVHAARIAERFGIDRLLIPYGSGVGSAIGMLATDISTERARTHLSRADTLDGVAVESIFQELAQHCIEDLETQGDALQIVRSLDMRYRGQAHELTVPAPEVEIGEDWLAKLVSAFHLRYAESYGSNLEGPVEIVGFRVRVSEAVQTPVIAAMRSGTRERAIRRRSAYFHELGGYVETPLHYREDLRNEERIEGPAIIEEREATVVVPPRWSARVDDAANLILHHADGAGEG